jgi:DNA-binding winged helix-turn-helix (wHTH) protein/cytochrome c-type biogenesis protein CcmH/NrfG
MGRYLFDRFELDAEARRLTRDGEAVALASRHFDVLLRLVSQPGAVVSKEALIEAAWPDVAVTDNSLEQAISTLRRALGPSADRRAYIQNVPRQGYRFTAAVARAAPRATDSQIEALLAPHRAWIEGRALLESFERGQILAAREVFERAVAGAPEAAAAHVGLANACVMQFEMTRADAAPDAGALEAAARHAREACRLDPQLGEAWAALGFALDRTGHRLDALAASRRAVALEADNWRHHFRLAYVAWGEERLREAHRTRALLPGFPLAHWLAATVHVARQVLDEAERELTSGIAVHEAQAGSQTRFSAVALYWLLGLLRLARDDEDGATAAFERELASEASGHLYARECCANTWYALGALGLRQGRTNDALDAFAHALERVPAHPLARAALSVLAPSAAAARRAAARSSDPADHGAMSIDAAMAQAVALVLAGAHGDASRLVETALASGSPGNAGWLLPLEPVLGVNARPDVWGRALAHLRTRAA